MMKFRPGYYEWLVLKDDEVIYAINIDSEGVDNETDLECYCEAAVEEVKDYLRDQADENYDNDDFIDYTLSDDEEDELKSIMRSELEYFIAA